ncbi:MAG: hypothetical protein EOM76_00905 [Sphingobacteriia bacterium]|jgi:hypothetical protein|nr:hypothetical protein [Paludibacteraceae bacterium]NCA78744.1 hypothetical protein [Sphingobacteriia bacterium]
MEDQKNKGKEIHELNLLDLIVMFFQWIKKICIWLFKFVLRAIRFGVQYFWVVLACACIALAMGIFFTQPSRIKVEGKSTLIFAPENRTNVYTNLKVLQSCCGDVKKMKQLLDVEDSVAKSIKKITVYNYCYSKDKYKDYKYFPNRFYKNSNYDDNQYTYENSNDRIVGIADLENEMSDMGDTTDLIMSDRLLISIKAVNLSDFNSFFAKITQYLLSKPEICGMHDMYVQQATERNDFCTTEIKRLDSLANYSYFNAPADVSLKLGQTVMLGEVRKQLLYEEINQLYSWKQRLSYELQRYKAPVAYVSDAVVVKTNRLVLLALWLCGGIAVGYCIALCVRYKKEIVAYMREK